MICAGRWNCPGDAERKARSERSGGRHIGFSGDFQRRPQRRALVRLSAIGGGNGNAARFRPLCRQKCVPSFRPMMRAARPSAVSALGTVCSPKGPRFSRAGFSGPTAMKVKPERRSSPIFLVATHSATQADSLVSEDRGYFRSYFPAVRLLTADLLITDAVFVN